MLPHGFEQSATVLLLVTGVLACFAGHRLFRTVLGLYGFLLGAMVASSVVGVSNNSGMLVSALVGGFLGAFVLVFAWFVGVSLVGAGMGVLAAHLVWRGVFEGDPPTLAVVAVAVAGAIGALFVQRYVIVFGTALAGAWTIVLSAVNAFPQGLVRGASDTEVWILYPTSTPGAKWAPIAWLALSVAGIATQMSGRKRGRK